ncbi:UNVERIFIED_CONTAM: hypothetical protein HDU68_004955, partial [Siphonaria sp. JEL0065]
MEKLTKIMQRYQINETVYTYLCDSDGKLVGEPIAVEVGKGTQTFANPGNNYTLQNAMGGISGVDFNFTSTGLQGFGSTEIVDGIVSKATLEFAINSVTGEMATFVNDWPITMISDRMNAILRIADFPISAFAVRCTNGRVTGISSRVPTFSGNKILILQEVNDPFVQDFSAFVNTTFTYGVVNTLTAQLTEISAYINTYYPGAANWFVDRRIDGHNWKLALNSNNILGQEYIFAVYMNVDVVELQLSTLSTRTGYMMIGIILTFVLVGIFYSTMISRQLHNVVTQIQLLKDLKFREVLSNQAGVKARSFIYELAELQKCFHGMVVVFSGLLKQNSSFARPTLAKESGPNGATPPIFNQTASWRKKALAEVVDLPAADPVPNAIVRQPSAAEDAIRSVGAGAGRASISAIGRLSVS